jgi:hypothetical protein
LWDAEAAGNASIAARIAVIGYKGLNENPSTAVQTLWINLLPGFAPPSL